LFDFMIDRKNIIETRPLKNVAWENANKLEKRKRACVTYGGLST